MDRKPMTTRKALDMGLGIPNTSKVFAGMINEAGQGSTVRLIENNDALAKHCQDPDFMYAVERARERGVEIKIVMCPTEQQYSKALHRELCTAYLSEGLDGVKKYLKQATTIDDKPISEETAYDMARSFEKDVLGKKD